MIGQTYGRLTVIRDTGERSGTAVRFECQCSCGAIRFVTSNHLRSGRTQSCGCFHLEQTVTHGHSRHGKITSEYASWRAMLSRCTNPKATGYENYGGRGIKVCKRWLVFENFLSDMGKKPNSSYDIDRKNNDGN